MKKYYEYGNFIIDLLNSLFRNEQPSMPDFECDWDFFYELCVHHKISNMIYLMVEKLDVPEQIKTKFAADFNRSVLTDAKQSAIAKKLFAEFENRQIPFLPVKGILIKQLYPVPAYRSSGDIDILIESKSVEKARQVMLDFGFEFTDFDGVEQHNDYEYHKKSVSIELHKSLAPLDSVHYSYFANAFEKAHTVANSSFHYAMTDEDFYIYTLFHMYKHFIKGGVGIKYYLDLYLINHKMSFDMNYINAELDKLGLRKFNERSKELAEMFFGDRKPDYELAQLACYVYVSGAHGEATFYALADFSGIGTLRNNYTKNKIRYYYKAWFIGRKAMQRKYPVLKKCPFLLPFCYIHKGIYSLLFRHSAVKKQMNSIKDMNKDKGKYLEYINSIAGIE